MNLPAAQPEELRLWDGRDAVLVFARSVDRLAQIHRLAVLDLVGLVVLTDIGPRAAQLLDLLDGPKIVPPPDLLSVRDHTARDETEAHEPSLLVLCPHGKANHPIVFCASCQLYHPHNLVNSPFSGILGVLKLAFFYVYGLQNSGYFSGYLGPKRN